jgi:drug/metabolite transporter (DMT)-like permease
MNIDRAGAPAGESPSMNTTTSTIRGVGFLVLSLLTFSLQDIAVKWIGGDYPISEIVLFRSIVALPAALLFVRAEGQRGLPTTQRRTLEYVRGLCLFLSFTTYMMGLAALPLAEVASIRFSAPLMITTLSVIFLGEQVEPRRWLALIVGFIGVLLIARLGSASFNLGSVFVLVSALFYALSVLITRQLRTTDSSATMAYYSSLVYVLGTAVLVPLTIAVGEVHAHPSIAFLLRAWHKPTLFDWVIMSGLGLVWASGMYLMARAYSLALASVVAPFEYATLPINAIWGFVLWQEIPTATTWIGALLTVFSGMYILYREQRERTAPARSSAAAIAINDHEDAHA